MTSHGTQRSNGSKDDSTEFGRELDEDEAVLYANLKGRRDKDLLRTARAAERLVEQRYRSNEALAAAQGVSAEIIREFRVLLTLPASILSLFERKLLTTLEQGYRLAQLARRRPDILDATAQAMVGMSAHDSRALVDYLRRHPTTGADDAKKIVLEAKTKIRDEYHVVAVLTAEQYRALRSAASKRRLDAGTLVASVVAEWLDGVAQE